MHVLRMHVTETEETQDCVLLCTLCLDENLLLPADTISLNAQHSFSKPHVQLSVMFISTSPPTVFNSKPSSMPSFWLLDPSFFAHTQKFKQKVSHLSKCTYCSSKSARSGARPSTPPRACNASGRATNELAKDRATDGNPCETTVVSMPEQRNGTERVERHGPSLRPNLPHELESFIAPSSSRFESDNDKATPFFCRGRFG